MSRSYSTWIYIPIRKFQTKVADFQSPRPADPFLMDITLFFFPHVLTPPVTNQFND